MLAPLHVHVEVVDQIGFGGPNLLDRDDPLARAGLIGVKGQPPVVPRQE